MPGYSPAGVVRDTSYIWLVHPVGLADLGLRGERDARDGQARLSELQETVAGGDLDRLWNLVWHERYESKAALPAASPGQYRDLPLPKLLRGLARPGTGVTRVRVLLVAATSEGRRFDGFPVADLSRCLRDAVTALRPMIHRETGSAFEIVDVEGAFPVGLEESNVLGALVERHEALRAAAPGRVMIGWGSGATSTPFGIASAAVRLGLPWHLLDYTAPDPSRGQAAAEVDPLEAVDRRREPAVPHLVRLRLFRELGALVARQDGIEPSVVLTPEQADALRDMIDLVERGYRAESAEALRQIALEALVRRDGTAGFALRRYVIERYREQCGRMALPVVKCARTETPILGTLRDAARAARVDAPAHPPNEWITSDEVGVIEEFGNAAHEFRLSEVEQADQIAASLSAWDGVSAAEARLEAFFGVRPAPGPASRLLAVWAVGPKDVGETRPTIARRLLDEGPGEAVVGYLGTAAFPLTALLLATSASSEAADIQIGELTSHPSTGPGAHRAVAVRRVDLPGNPPDRESARQEIHDALAEVLRDGAEDVGGILVVPTGSKPVVLAALQELFPVSAALAVPLFVLDMSEGSASGPALHLWPASVGHDGPLFAAALAAYERLELDVAARLLAATSRAEDLSLQCQELAVEFTGRGAPRDAVPVDQAPPRTGGHDRPGQLAQRLALVADRARAAAERVDRAGLGRDGNALLTRYLVLAATLDENWGPLRPTVDVKGKPSWTMLESIGRDGGHSHQPHAAVVLTLRTARNKVPLTHAKVPLTHAKAPDAEEAVSEALVSLKRLGVVVPHHEPWPDTPTVIGFLQAAPAAVAPWDRPAPAGPPLLDRYHELRQAIVNARAGRFALR